MNRRQPFSDNQLYNKEEQNDEDPERVTYRNP